MASKWPSLTLLKAFYVDHLSFAWKIDFASHRHSGYLREMQILKEELQKARHTSVHEGRVTARWDDWQEVPKRQDWCWEGQAWEVMQGYCVQKTKIKIQTHLLGHKSALDRQSTGKQRAHSFQACAGASDSKLIIVQGQGTMMNDLRMTCISRQMGGTAHRDNPSIK